MIYVGGNCNVEYQMEGSDRKYLTSFTDIQDILYEPELTTRGRVVMDIKNRGQVCVALIRMRQSLFIIFS